MARAEARETPPRVALVNLGCRVNRVELDAMALQLERCGCELTSQREADVIVINTCAVTGEAQAKTRKAIRHAASLPQQPLVIATGCVANLFADELRALSPRVVVEVDKSKVAERALASWGDAVPAGMSASAEPMGTPTGRTRHGIKVQDGCDLRCTYCIVWKARGRSRSVSPRQVLDELRQAQCRGAREVVLTGINLGCYRTEEDGVAYDLPSLLELLLAQTDIGRIRLSSIEPPDVTDELLGVMAQAGERVAPFMHICLQSGCDRTLREMGRIYDVESFADIVRRARAALPDLALGTDLIVGFPGETDEDFAASYAFCESMAFARMHVFRYSRRPGTPAAARNDQVSAPIIARRSQSMLELAERMRQEQALLRLGAQELVVVQDVGRGVTGGLFDALVDEHHHVGDLVHATVAAVGDNATLDCRNVM